MPPRNQVEGTDVGTTSKPGHALGRRYSLIAAASAVPLVLVIFLLAWMQFQSQRAQLIEELEGEVVKHGALFGNLIGAVRDHVRSLDAWAGIYLKDPSLNAEVALGPRLATDGALGADAVWRPADARLFRSGDGAGRPDAAELAMAEGLVQHMRLAHRAMPYLRWSYYFGSDGEFFTLYPFARSDVFGGSLRTASDDRIAAAMMAQPILSGPDLEARTTAAAGSYWTPAFLDPAGAGWIVVHASRVDGGIEGAGGRSGTVGAAVLLDFLTAFIRAFDYPCGKAWLVNDQGQVLAAFDGLLVSGLRLLSLEDVLPAPLKSLDPATLTAAADGFETFEGFQVISLPINAAPWHFIYVLEPGEVTALILPRFIPYGIILLGLVLTLFFAQYLRQRLVVGPALALADYVKTESQERPTSPPDLPTMWRPWVSTVSEAFSAKREANRRIQESEAYVRTMAEAHPVPVAIVKRDDGRVLHASRAFADLLGTPLENLIGTDIRRFYADARDRDTVVDTLSREGGVQNFEHWARRADGSRFLASVTSRAIAFEGVDAVVSGIVDLTEQRAAEAKIAEQREALKRSEQRFRTIAEGHPVPVGIVRRADQRVLYASKPFADLLGMALEDLYAADPRSFYADSDDRRRIGELLHQRQVAEHVEVDIRRPDGSVFPAAVTCKLIDYEGEEAIVSSIVDLTEKKRAESEIARQRDALHQAEKLNALGSLLANVAHELNNPLSVVVGYATMQLDLSTDPAVRERAEKIHAAAERCARIVRTFLAMARQKEEARGPVELDKVLDSALEIAGYGLRTADIELKLDLDPRLPPLLGDADQLTLVFMNLIVNAQHALQNQEGPKRLVIRTGSEGGRVVAEFADNGPGVDGDIVERIFDPFFTTKPQGVGTGIGLSVCHSIVRAHEGEITVASTIEGGALFRVGLPKAAATGLTGSGWTSKSPQARLQGRIMVVEDEPEIADMIAEMLRDDGHEVLISDSGRAALAAIDGQPPDLVITDLRMPGLGGPDLHRLLSESRPELAHRMLFVTGDTLALGLGDFFERTGLPLLEKPLEPWRLRREVQRLLAAFARRQAKASTVPDEQGGGR